GRVVGQRGVQAVHQGLQLAAGGGRRRAADQHLVAGTDADRAGGGGRDQALPAQGDRDGAVGLDAGLRTGQVGQAHQQRVALVEQRVVVAAGRRVDRDRVVQLGQLAGRVVDLGGGIGQLLAGGLGQPAQRQRGLVQDR